jgi:hypothetical protein
VKAFVPFVPLWFKITLVKTFVPLWFKITLRTFAVQNTFVI